MTRRRMLVERHVSARTIADTDGTVIAFYYAGIDPFQYWEDFMLWRWGGYINPASQWILVVEVTGRDPYRMFVLLVCSSYCSTCTWYWSTVNGVQSILACGWVWLWTAGLEGASSFRKSLCIPIYMLQAWNNGKHSQYIFHPRRIRMQHSSSLCHGWSGPVLPKDRPCGASHDGTSSLVFLPLTCIPLPHSSSSNNSEQYCHSSIIVFAIVLNKVLVWIRGLPQQDGQLQRLLTRSCPYFPSKVT